MMKWLLGASLVVGGVVVYRNYAKRKAAGGAQPTEGTPDLPASELLRSIEETLDQSETEFFGLVDLASSSGDRFFSNTSTSTQGGCGCGCG